MVANSSNTIYDRLISLYGKVGKVYKPPTNTTLNEKLNVYPNIDTGTQTPVLKYLGISNGGNDIIYDVLKTSEHSVKDGSLFNPIPFLIIEKSKDLTVQERSKYRLRKETLINGIEYVEYYLKLIDSITDPEVYIVEKTGEITTNLIPFNFNDPSILNPQPKIKEDFVNANVNNYIAVTSNVSFSLTVLEMDNVKKAIELKYGVTSPKIISEMALFSGIDYVTVNGTEALSVQASFFQTVQFDLQSMIFTGKPLLKEIQIGGSEVLR